MADEVTWKEYRNAPANVIWMWAIRKKSVGDSIRRSRRNRTQMQKRQDQMSSREFIKDLTSNNSMAHELITEDKEEERRLKERKYNSEGIDRIINRAELSISARRLDTSEIPNNKAMGKLFRDNK